MRKAGQIICSAIMLTAVFVAKADPQSREASDSVSSQHGSGRPYAGRSNYPPS